VYQRWAQLVAPRGRGLFRSHTGKGRALGARAYAFYVAVGIAFNMYFGVTATGYCLSCAQDPGLAAIHDFAPSTKAMTGQSPGTDGDLICRAEEPGPDLIRERCVRLPALRQANPGWIKWLVKR